MTNQTKSRWCPAQRGLGCVNGNNGCINCHPSGKEFLEELWNTNPSAETFIHSAREEHDFSVIAIVKFIMEKEENPDG